MSDDKRDVLRISAVEGGYRVPPDHHPMNPKQPAKPIPCPTCICRVANQDRKTDRGPDWDEAYETTTLRAVWDGSHEPRDPSYAMGNGGLNHCHQGHACACAGTQVVQEREVLRWKEHGECALSDEGLRRVFVRMFGDGAPGWMVGAVTRETLLKHAHPALRDPAIGHPSTEPPEPGEFDE